jgi:Excalibur calcium-binding domain/Protein of unknown function (DUF1524)
MRRLLALMSTCLLTATLLGAFTASASAEGRSARADRQVTMRLRAAVRQLPVARETRAGYDRDRFRHWVDADGDCRDTRDEVLAAESRTRVRGCDVRRGRWISYYDRSTWRDSGDVDIDHLVALAEAWDSGAKRWNARTRQRFANDLGDRRSLVAVTDNVNMSKSDRDPAEWMPRFGQCRYVQEWTAVKIRWSLRVDRAEKRALQRRAARCANTRLQVRRTGVGLARSGGGRRTGGGGGGRLDPRFDYCYQANDRGYGNYRRGRDPEYRWYTDGDSDGWACEF